MDPTVRSSGEDRLVQALSELAAVQLELDRERLRRVEIEGLFAEVVAAMSDALVLADARGRVRQVNDAGAELLGRDAEELVGSDVRDVLGSAVPASAWAVFERSPTGQLSSVETTVPAKDGARPVTLSCAVMRDPAGKVIGTVYALRDLSETHHLLHRLEALEARWRLLARVGELLSGEIDPRDALGEVCRSVSDATGARVAVLLADDSVVAAVVTDSLDGGGSDWVMETIGAPVRAGTALATALHEGRTVHAPVLAPDFPLLASPAPRPPAASAALLPLAAKGKAVGAMLLLSERPGAVDAPVVELAQAVASRVGLALANARLRDSVSELERGREAARSRQEMVAGLSHDMKTPLTVIQGSIAALERHGEQIEPADRVRLYAAMSRQSQRLRSLVQQFLDYSRLEAGHRLPIHLRPVSVAPIVERVLGTWGMPSVARAQVEEDLPPALADPDRLEQILANLVSNAIKFSPPGAEVRVEARRSGAQVEISVTDRGRGMSPRDLAMVFEKFHRGAGARGTEGTGLGLYVSKALAEAQGGRMTVTSRIGEGSRFTVTLPASTGKDRDVNETGARRGRPA